MTTPRSIEQALHWTMRLAGGWARQATPRERLQPSGVGDGDLYAVQIATPSAGQPAFRAQWQALLETSPQCHRLYQSPAFFDVASAHDDRTKVDLLAVTRIADGALVAVVPLRISRHRFTIGIGGKALLTWRAQVVNLLGSTPARGIHPVPLSLVAGAALDLFPEATFCMLQALPQDGGDWRELSTCASERRVTAALLGHWRACHTMPVPSSLAAYGQQFAAKKRYNLKRQVRQLADACGPISLERIERVDQVDSLYEALAVLRGPHALDNMQRRSTSVALAQHGLLLCFVLRTGEAVRGVVFATRSDAVLHVHNIFVDDSQRHLSIGTSTMHLTMENLIGMACFTLIDFGYGTPKHDFGSSHLLEMRAPVLVARSASAARFVLAVHCWLLRSTERLARAAKWLRARVRHLRRASRPASA